MDQKQLKPIVDSFFVCDKQQIAEIFNEFLSAMEAEELLPPGGLMSRNYETAQANPEIHTLPGNLKDARDAIFPFFWGTDGWYNKLHLENVKGPANYASLIGALACLLKNPNLCVDTYCLRSNELEVKAVTSLANLIFYHTESPWGVFTMGGTISNLYGGKIGIERVCPGAMEHGFGNIKVAGIVSEAAHYSNATLAGWLGMGTRNLHAIATDRSLAMRLDQLEEKLDELYSKQVRVAFVIATFGSTDAFGIDDIAGIRQMIEDKAAKNEMPVPQLHVRRGRRLGDLFPERVRCGRERLRFVRHDRALDSPHSGVMSGFSARRQCDHRLPQNGLGPLSVQCFHCESTRRLEVAIAHQGGNTVFLRSGLST